MSTTDLCATSQLRETMTEFWVSHNFAKGKSTTVFRDLDEFVTERVVRFIAGRHAQGSAERFRLG